MTAGRTICPACYVKIEDDSRFGFRGGLIILAARLTSPFNFEYVDIPIPQAGDDEVLVKLAYMGICGSDMHMYHGKHPYMSYPVIPGHEMSGVIETVGPKVEGYSAGDKVLVYPEVICHNCYSCKMGRHNVCEHLKVMGVHMDGGATRYLSVKPFNLCKAPDNLDCELIPLAEPLAVGIASVKRSAHYRQANIVIVGAGTIGNLTAQAAQAMGASRVMITDVKQKKLDYAKECGISYCVNTENVSLKEAIIEVFGPERKADIIIDCAANTNVFNSIMEAARKNSTVVFTGNYNNRVDFNIPTMQRQEISLIGHILYVKDDIYEALDMLGNGRIYIKNFITQRYNLEQIHEAFAFVDKNPDDVIKPIVKLNQ